MLIGMFITLIGMYLTYTVTGSVGFFVVGSLGDSASASNIGNGSVEGNISLLQSDFANNIGYIGSAMTFIGGLFLVVSVIVIFSGFIGGDKKSGGKNFYE